MSFSREELVQVVTNSIQQSKLYKGFFFRSPAITLTGGYSVNQIGDVLIELGVTKVFIVVDKMVYQLGLLEGCQHSLTFAGIEYTIFSEVVGEPDSDIISKCIQKMKTADADFVLGIGGGSALDVAKAVAVMVDYTGSISDFKVGGLASRRVGLGAIPTTAGTGSEVTDITVVKDLATGVKLPIKGPALVPDLAIIDPALMLGVPPEVTAATGVDTLTHAIEAYVSRGSNPLSKAYAYHAVEAVARSLRRAVGCGDNLDDRYDMAVAAYKAGLAFSNAGLGLTHAISHQIGSQFHIPHGTANAILLPYVMAFNALVSEAEYAELAVALGVARENMTQRECCWAAIKAVSQLVQDLGLPTSLAHVDIHLESMLSLAEDALEDICLGGNPRTVTAKQIISLLQDVVSGSISGEVIV
ncbi:iron-containing alcohol dehydrogenase family protein [Vibrio sp. F74]|uniref:iron-containing alcohol dehydrogenase family protein n=1 Tax=Vibrio sp. F74 TaxID=700020 RepID=UPI0035F54A4C